MTDNVVQFERREASTREPVKIFAKEWDGFTRDFWESEIRRSAEEYGLLIGDASDDEAKLYGAAVGAGIISSMRYQDFWENVRATVEEWKKQTPDGEPID